MQTGTLDGLTLAPALSAAVLYAAFAAALLALAHRLVLHLSWRAALALALLPLCFTGRALLTGQVYAPIGLAYSTGPLLPAAAQYGVEQAGRGILLDVASQMIPWRQAVRHAVRQGEWPLWNPFILCGDPLAGAAQPAPYHPITALALLLPLALAFTFGAAALLLAAALAMFLYLRDLGCGEAAAFFGAVAWAFSDFVAFWLEWPLGAAVALAPLVFLGARRLVKRPGWPSALLLAVGLALTVLAGHPESAVHVVAMGAVLGLAEAAVAPPRRWGVIAAWTLAAGALACALSAVFLLPVVEVLLQSSQWLLRRASPVAPLLALAAPAAQAWRHLAASVLPSMADLPPLRTQPFLLQPLYSAYAGSALWGPALYGLARGPWRGRFVVAALGFGGLCAGARMPVIFPLVSRLPLFSMSINERLVFAAAFATATLAALGVEAWLRTARPAATERAPQTARTAPTTARNRPTKPDRSWTAGACCLAGDERAGSMAPKEAARTIATTAASPGFAGACAMAALVLAGAVSLLAFLGLDGFPGPAIGHWAVWSLVPLLAVTLIAGLAALPRLSRRTLAWCVAALAVVLAAERTGEMGSYYPTFPARAFFPRIAPLGALPADGAEPWRAVGLGFQLIPNQGALYGIEDLRGYQAIHNRRFADLLPLWVALNPRWYLAVTDLERPFLRLVNVRYAFTAPSQDAPGWRLVASGRDSRLWESPRALPRAFVPRRVRLGVRPDAEVEEMKAEADFGRRAWIVPPGGGDHGPPREEPNGRGWVVAYRHGLGLALTARMRRPGWAVITETAWAGWRARLDGREVPLGIGDHAFLALAIPAGWHQAELFYRPRSFEIGLALSAAALALIAGVSLAGAAARKPL